MIPRFDHNVSNEIAMQGIGAHKNGPLAAVWLELLVFVHNLSEEGAHRVDFSAQ